MWNDGNYVLWQHIAQLFYQDVENGLKLMPRLSYDHMKLNSYSTVRVSLAAQILSSTVAAVIINIQSQSMHDDFQSLALPLLVTLMGGSAYILTKCF